MSKKRREARKAARIERVKTRQAAKTARVAQRGEARQTRAAVRQTARLAKVAKRKKINESLANLGAAAEAQKAAAAIRNVKVAKKIRRYVENNGGEIPEDAQPEEVAAIADEIRNEEVQDTQEALNEGLEEGQEPYTEDEAEQELYDMYDADSFDGEDDPDNYDPATAAAVKAAAKKGVELLAERRAKQGKKTLGMTPEELEKKLNPQYAPEKDPTTDAGKIYAAGKGAYVESITKQNADWIVIIMLLLIAVGVFYGLSKRK